MKILNRNRQRFLPLVAGIAMLLLVQACGNSGNLNSPAGNGQAVSSAAPSATAAPENAAAAETLKAPAELRIGYIGNNKKNLPGGAEGWGFSNGIITDGLAGLGVANITFVGFNGGSDLNEALIGGRLDIGIYGDTPAISARSRGAKTKLVGQPSNSIIIYLIGKKDGVSSVAELKGKKVATQKGSVLHRYTAGILAKEGIFEPDKLLQLNASDVESALARGDIDAGSLNGGTALSVIAKGYPELDNSSNNPSLSGSLVTVASEEYLSEFPEFPKVWTELRAKALADLKTQPDAYYDFLSEINGFEPEIVKQTDPIENIAESSYTDASLQQLEDVKKFLLDEKLIEEDFDIKEWIAQSS
ncbi:ABC transporter substrate-binding protein [Paenibacillus sp. S150]|uniref:ABC transporter substrate-binding protein n=1 Tax=Paenibacillus sp. S150 TaxID=2749826 RepID=UPI001C59D84D|nr:ABC transporter substrate-binding protein [Paenibacillus sp. S150]MBW4079826.1 ABC transporter substrate-binding protein [Paenibacillus sp. S150]